MRTWMMLALAVVCLSLTCGEAVADGDSEKSADKKGVLAAGLDALKLRIEAAMKRAALLEKLGRTEEALALYEEIEGLYEKGIAELKKLSAERGSTKPKVADKPFSGPATNDLIGRGGMTKRRGGGAISGLDARRQQQRAKEAIESGLAWLAKRQRDDGGWPSAKPEHRVGATGLALLSFLGAGYTHEDTGDYKTVVARGLDFLRRNQDPQGCFAVRRNQHYNYDHAMATLAVVEAYGMTSSALLHGTAQKALDFSALSRNPYFGWRYGIKPGDNDTSMTHWMLAGIYSAKKVNDAAAAAGKPAPFTIDDGAFQGAIAWVDKMTDPDYGRVGYIVRGSGPARARDMLDKFPAERSESMTAAGIHIRLMCGQDPATKGVIGKGMDLIYKLPPVWHETNGSIDMYYWYLGTQAAFQTGGRKWKRWRGALLDAVIPNQAAAPETAKGSWPAIGPWGHYGGTVVSTAWMTLCLEIAERSFTADK